MLPRETDATQRKDDALEPKVRLGITTGIVLCETAIALRGLSIYLSTVWTTIM